MLQPGPTASGSRMTQADMLIETDALEQVRTIPITPSFQYMRPPRIYDPHLMPPDVARILRRRWNLSKHVIPPVAFHLARDVYVVEEGLVFTGDGHLVAASQADVPAHEIVRARATLQASLAQPASIPSHPRAILCKKRGAGNYGHWLAEMLPRAYVARQYLPDRDWPVVIHAVEGTLRTVMRESLHAVGITENRIIESGGAPVHFAELLVPSGLTAHAVFLSPLVMECMDFIADQVPPADIDALYIPRAPATTRDFEDEAAVRTVFEQHGYTTFAGSTVPFMEQVAMFRSARRVVGAMGAGLSNTLFCRPATEVLVFMPGNALELFYWLIAEGRKLDYHEVRTPQSGRMQGSLPWDRQLAITPAEVERMLARLEAGKPAFQLTDF